MITLEICCGSVADAKAAELAGADRIELNSALPLGGLTPDIGSLILIKEQVKLPVISMLRPRAGGFCYTADKYETMKKSAQILLEAGSDGLAFGFLKEDRTIDGLRTREFTELVHSYGREAVFHRAVDVTWQIDTAVEQLIEAGVDRVLTSGGGRTAIAGAECLERLQRQYGTAIQIMAGSGIRSGNAESLLQQTGIRQIHSFCGGTAVDKSARGNDVSFACAAEPEWYRYEVVAQEEVRRLRRVLG